MTGRKKPHRHLREGDLQLFVQGRLSADYLRLVVSQLLAGCPTCKAAARQITGSLNVVAELDAESRGEGSTDLE